MDQPSGSLPFVFVDPSSDGGVPTGQDTRRLIRRQAMRSVAAARRQTGNWGQQNLRQYPVSPFDVEEQAKTEAEAAESSSARVDSSHQQQGLIPAARIRTPIPLSVPSSGYELMRINYGFDLLDLSALTTFHTGRITAQLLSREPLRLTHVLRYNQWSYLSFLPSLYGNSACLDHAAHCVVARLRQWTSAPYDPPNDGVLSLYSKSLTSLQSALNDPVLCLNPETQCATAILGIYELLDVASEQGWVRHTAGASALMKLRGPQRYKTDFEKALFLAQVGPIYTEALLNDDRCFLEQDIWQTVFTSVVHETDRLSDTSGIVVSLWTIICPVPSLFKDIQNAVCNSIDMDMRIIDTLLARVREVRRLLLQWRRQHDDLFSPHNTHEQSNDGKEYDTIGIYMANMILVNRLTVSLSPPVGSDLEIETRDLAHGILQLERRASVEDPRASLFMAFKIITAQTVIDTEDEWQRAVDLSNEDQAVISPLISANVFERWVRLKGRKITTTISTLTSRRQFDRRILADHTEPKLDSGDWPEQENSEQAGDDRST